MATDHQRLNSRPIHPYRRRAIPAPTLAVLVWFLVLGFVFSPRIVLPESSEQEAALAEAKRLHKEASVLSEAGKYFEAESILHRSLAILEEALKLHHESTSNSIKSTIERTKAQHLYDTAWLLYLRGQYDRVVTLATQGLKIDKRNGSALGMADGLNLVGTVYYKRGDYLQAIDYYLKAAGYAESVNYRFGLGRNWSSIGSTYYRQGNYGLAKEYYEKSLRIRKEIGDKGEIARALNDLANVFQQLGNYPRSLRLREEALHLWQQTGNKVGIADVLNDIGWIYDDLGDYNKALTYLGQSLAMSREVGLEWGVADGIDGIGLINLKMGKFHGALERFQEAHSLFEKAGNQDEMARTLNHIGEALYRLDKYQKAELAYQQALAIVERIVGSDHPSVALNLNNLSAVYHAQGQHARGEALVRRAVTIYEKALGTEHPNVATSLNNLASMLAVQGRHSLARPLYERARRIQLAIGRINVGLDDEALRGLLKASHSSLHNYADLLATIAGDERPRTSPNPAELDAFVVGEQVRGGVAQAALARAGARSAARTQATAALARQVQELRNHRQVVRRQLSDEYKKTTAKLNTERLKALQEVVQRLDRDLSEAVARLNTAFPKYTELASPEPINVMGIRKMLRSGEALVSYFTLDDRLLIWLVRRGRDLVYRDIEIKKSDLGKLVGRVRASLDQSRNPELSAGRFLPFDVAGSYELFKLLILPIQEELSGVRHLIAVPDEVLLPLPFGALVTHEEGEPYKSLADLYNQKLAPSPKELADYAKLSWLAKDYSIAVLPSATSLRALRQIARTKRNEVEPFIGFGDPVLEGDSRKRGGTMLASRGVSLPVDELRKLDRLPATRGELEAVARALGADPNKALNLGIQATEPVVRMLNASGRLGRAQVVSFATHGLIGGEVKGLKEPALVLTPPEKPTEKDDGLLGLEDILALKLDSAEWVILSACNTAAPGGSGEGLSGLVRAFFFAGARSLLVSHWSVDDRATQSLMTEIFQRYARDKTVARSEALRQGMLALLAKAKGETTYFAHPFAWAPFFLVGEGGGGTS